jgi:hypothetical protein
VGTAVLTFAESTQDAHSMKSWFQYVPGGCSMAMRSTECLSLQTVASYGKCQNVHVDVSGQPIVPIFRRQAVQEFFQLPTSKKSDGLKYTTANAEARNLA